MPHAQPLPFWVVMALLIAPLGFIGCDDGQDTKAVQRGEDWSFTLEPVDEGTRLETRRFTVLFEGQKISDPIEGTIRVAGPGNTNFSVPSGVVSTEYANGTAAIRFGDQTLFVENNGQAVKIGDVVYQLRDEVTDITIAPDGTTQINPRK